MVILKLLIAVEASACFMGLICRIAEPRGAFLYAHGWIYGLATLAGLFVWALH